jgi:hypothetical protein
MRIQLVVLPWLTLFLIGWVVPVARGDESYYMIVFGSQLPKVNLPAHTHSFAMFLRACGEGPCWDTYALQGWTISWMPESLKIEILRLFPTCGNNLGLHESLKWAAADGQRISMWGPYRIQKELFDRALGQVAHLKSGNVAYKSVDMCRNTDRVTNCIHALSNISTENSQLHCSVSGWGEPASYWITLHLAPWIIDYHQTHDWLLDRIGLRCYPLVRRDLSRNPAKNPVLRLLEAGEHWSLQKNLHD